MHALFPISVDNASFTTEATVVALEAGLRHYEKITFLVADRIQVYNDLAKMCGDLPRMAALDWSGRYRRDLVERKQWLGKVRRRLRDWPDTQEWQTIGFANATDASAFEALRGLWLMYQVDREFRADVDETTDHFIKDRGFCGDTDSLRRLSKVYIIEEIAINLRLRLSRAIYDEYYIGKTIKVLLKLYGGSYIKAAGELFRSRRRHTHEFSFFEWTGREWIDANRCVDRKPRAAIALVKSI